MNDDFARATPMQLCLLYLEQAAHEAERAIRNPQRWFFAVPEMHRALNCALVAALSGSEGIGAYPEKIRRQWILHFEHPDWPDRGRPRDDRVEPFTDLLKRSQDATDPWMEKRPIHLTEAQRADLARLTDFRDDMEHVKPGGWSLEVAGLPSILAAAADVLSQLFQERRCCTDLEPKDEDRAAAAIARIRALAAVSAPPPAG